MVLLNLLGQEIGGVGLLEQSVALVLLILEDAHNSGNAPLLFAGRRRDALPGQIVCNCADGLAAQIEGVDFADDFRLFLHDPQGAVPALLVAQKAAVGQRELPIGHALTLAPADILADRAAFFLRQTAHDGDHQLAFGVHGVDILLLEVDLHAFFFELTDCG